jgi:hypothetical protein
MWWTGNAWFPISRSQIGRRAAAVAALAVVGLAGLRAVEPIGAQSGEKAGQRGIPVLAELFTSEGCSSCPPADDLLSRLMEDQPVPGVEVIALSEHVDYWDRLGWKDPFSSKDFTRRQNQYAQALRRNDIYTPQLVVDGRMAVIGSDWSQVRPALVEAARAPRATVEVTAVAQDAAGSASVTIVVRDLPDPTGNVDVVVAIVEDGLTTNVLRGENARKMLRHSAVARSLAKIGTLKTGQGSGEFSQTVICDRAWRTERLRVVAFVQDSRTRRVLGAGTADIR